VPKGRRLTLGSIIFGLSSRDPSSGLEALGRCALRAGSFSLPPSPSLDDVPNFNVSGSGAVFLPGLNIVRSTFCQIRSKDLLAAYIFKTLQGLMR
jgi:hypothetical protein